MKTLLFRNKYYRVNPILKKEQFSFEDEKEISNWLRRENPLLLKCKKVFMPSEVAVKNDYPLKRTYNEEYFENFVSTFKNE